MNVYRKCIVIGRKIFFECSTNIISFKITILNNYNFIIILISAKFFLTVMNMNSSLYFWPIYNHLCWLGALRKKWKFIEAYTTRVKVRCCTVSKVNSLWRISIFWHCCYWSIKLKWRSQNLDFANMSEIYCASLISRQIFCKIRIANIKLKR